MSDLFNSRGARFSPCRRFRYVLWRRWGEGAALNFIGLNPSTADESVNDPTVERMERRARAWGYPALVVTNLFALRATDPKEMLLAPDAGGGLPNICQIIEVAQEAARVLCGWGGHGAHRGQASLMTRHLRERGVALYALKVGKNGQPCHPLYLPYALKPERWE